MTMQIPAHDHDRVMNMIAGIIERGDDKLADAEFNDARWLIDILLGQMGYKLHITEDGAAEIWPEGGSDSMEPGERPYTAHGYREGEVAGKWYHTEDQYLAAVAKHNELAAALNTLDRMAQSPMPPVSPVQQQFDRVTDSLDKAIR